MGPPFDLLLDLFDRNLAKSVGGDVDDYASTNHQKDPLDLMTNDGHLIFEGHFLDGFGGHVCVLDHLHLKTTILQHDVLSVDVSL